ncbi:MAG: hybrid sensor histidine kinase/response regulator [Elusimicrobia bacterium]|nr:hybrid sensor histidine kinase/response regulator [Elusimicrobiota bacterium]
MNEEDRQSILRHFLEEAGEHLGALSKALGSIGGAASAALAPEALDEVLRRLHSIKGASRVVGALDAAALAHALEAVVAEVRARRLALGQPVMDAVLDSIDVLKDSVDAAAGTGAAPDAEKAASRLLALISATRPEGQGLATRLPALDPELASVLSDPQVTELLYSLDSGKRAWEAVLDADAAAAGASLDAARLAAQDAGDFIGATGLTSPAGRRRFVFLVATRWSDDAAKAHFEQAGLTARDPSAAPAPAPEPADEEFERQKRRLVEQYLSQGAEEAEQFAKDVLSLESKPGDLGVVNGLFRLAHNLKGSAGMYGLPGLSTLSAHIERLLDALRNRKLECTPAVANVLLSAADALRELFATAVAGDHGAEASPAVLASLQAALKPGAAAPAPAAAPPEPPKAPDPKAKPLTRGSIRVPLERLDRLVNLGGEMTLGQNSREAAVKTAEGLADQAKAAARSWSRLRETLRFLKTPLDAAFVSELDELGRELERLQGALEGYWNGFSSTTLQAAAVVDAVQDEIMRVRMVPVSTLFDSAPRLIRELTKDKVREVDLAVAGEDTGMDKNVLEQMSDPLMHLIRNAVDHGIEPAAERERLGKPRRGHVRLAAEHQGSQIVITVTDDGRGMDPKLLAKKAVEKGLVSAAEAQTLSVEQAYAFIFHPGFSTKEHVTEISGRGVGMDVVRHNIESLKGRIDIASVVGAGTTFTVRLPLSLSVVEAVLLECGDQTFCLQASAVQRIVMLHPSEIEREEGHACFEHGGRTIPLVRLADLFGMPEDSSRDRQLTAVITQATQGTIGFVVDRAVGEQTVVLKEMGHLLRNVPHVSGGTILADGRVSIVLDPAGLVKSATRGEGRWEARPAPEPRRRLVLVVDDSLTSRELLRVLLENAGYSVVVARHGKEAVRVLEEREVDAVVSDVQMPELDGYGLAGLIKKDPRWSALPVILVSSLAKDEEKLKGLNAGADAYIAKGAFDQGGLLARLEELLGGAP